MGTHATAIVLLANTHQFVSLKLTNTNYLYWRMLMKPYLLGQGVFHFVDGSMLCPPSHIFDSSAGPSSIISPSFLPLRHPLCTSSASYLSIAISLSNCGSCCIYSSANALALSG